MYCVDTSALVQAWREDQPPDVFPSLWEKLAESIDEGVICASRSVLVELERQEDELCDWARDHRNFFQEDDEPVQDFIREFYAAWPRNVDWGRRLLGADLFVIGRARANGHAVVTAERLSNQLETPKIPDACRIHGVRCIRFVDMAREQGWAF